MKKNTRNILIAVVVVLVLAVAAVLAVVLLNRDTENGGDSSAGTTSLSTSYTEPDTSWDSSLMGWEPERDSSFLNEVPDFSEFNSGDFLGYVMKLGQYITVPIQSEADFRNAEIEWNIVVFTAERAYEVELENGADLATTDYGAPAMEVSRVKELSGQLFAWEYEFTDDTCFTENGYVAVPDGYDLNGHNLADPDFGSFTYADGIASVECDVTDASGAPVARYTYTFKHNPNNELPYQLLSIE